MSLDAYIKVKRASDGAEVRVRTQSIDLYRAGSANTTIIQYGSASMTVAEPIDSFEARLKRYAFIDDGVI